jgi:hypothetical protein
MIVLDDDQWWSDEWSGIHRAMHDESEIKIRTKAKRMTEMESMSLENAIRFHAEAKARQEWNRCHSRMESWFKRSLKHDGNGIGFESGFTGDVGITQKKCTK